MNIDLNLVKRKFIRSNIFEKKKLDAFPLCFEKISERRSGNGVFTEELKVICKHSICKGMGCSLGNEMFIGKLTVMHKAHILVEKWDIH